MKSSHRRDDRVRRPAATVSALWSSRERERVRAALGRSRGMPLDAASRATFEPVLGVDLGTVRVHEGADAGRSAIDLNAGAYALGDDVVFAPGRYRPQTASGRRLLAHELVHVVQQRRSPAPASEIGSPGDPDEQSAERVAASLSWGALASRYPSIAGGIEPRPAVPATRGRVSVGGATARIQRVQLTYDDGPDSAGNTAAVLAELKRAGARATFYLVGKRVAQGDNWKVVFDIAASGNWLGNHAYDWNDATDNHMFLSGTAKERAEKILWTEWAIRDALIQGRDAARKGKTWDSIPKNSRDYIEDVIDHGTGRFRTPGFRSKPWKHDGITTLAALASVNKVLAAAGLRPLKATLLDKWYAPAYEGVTVDPEDWKKGRTKEEIEKAVKGSTTDNSDSILLHSRIEATAKATPEIVKHIKGKKFTYDPTVQGKLGSNLPKAGFAGLSTISDPPTAAEVQKARAYLMKHMKSFGPYLSGALALGIFQLAQAAGPAEVNAFVAEIKATKIEDKKSGTTPMANWLNAYPDWATFAWFFEAWAAKKAFPRLKGVTI